MRNKKHLGQHFLDSQEMIQEIVNISGKIENKNILEVGPGIGHLTQEILKHSPNKLCAIEIDKECIAYHNELLLQHKNYQLIQGDALEIQEKDILLTPIKVIANLPYNISIELLCKWLDNIHLFESFTLMFQKEVAERIVAQPNSKKYGKMSIITQLLGSTEYILEVPKYFFSPQPKVDSAVIKITPYHKPLFEVDMKSLKDILRILFCYRRKMVHTILKKEHYDIENILRKLNINMKARPENLSIEQFCKLAKYLK